MGSASGNAPRPRRHKPVGSFWDSIKPATFEEDLKKIDPLYLTSDGQEKAERDPVKPYPSDDPEDVLFNNLYGVRTIDLNRPKKLHSLDGSMIRKILSRLQEWEKSDMANVIVIKGTGPKAFCAGGDVAALAIANKEGEEGSRTSTNYFSLEYKMNHLIATYSKPYVAFMDGITMGGGVGLSIHAPFRIATERTVFAMPETTIGFFPDVGASFFLPRMPGAVGTYLALTSEKLKGVNVFYAGIATHYIHSTSLPALERRLAELQFKDYDSKDERMRLVNQTIEEFCTGLPHDEPILLKGGLRQSIDRCFSQNSVTEIIDALKQEKENPKRRKWANDTLETLHKRSPTSVHVTLHQMRLGRSWSIAETFRREHQIAAKFMRHPDFVEGVDALLIRKDGKPQWKPASLEDISPKDQISRPFLLMDDVPFALLNSRDYSEYPYNFGIPNEQEVEALVNSGLRSWAVIKHFNEKTQGKQGVEEVVHEMVKRLTAIAGNEKHVAANIEKQQRAADARRQSEEADVREQQEQEKAEPSKQDSENPEK